MIADASAPPLEPFERRSVIPAGLLSIVLIVAAGGYGFQRDELYYMANGHHPAWGYVDHPPLTPMVGKLSQAIFGDSLRGLRILPALFAGVIIIVAALLCREIGGSRGAQLLAAVATATTSVAFAFGHLLMTPTLDVISWSFFILLLCRLVRTGDQRWWLAIGAVLGIGLMNKFTVLFAIASYGLGLLLTPQRRLLLSWWLVGGALIALVLWAPNLWWQIDHSWPIFDFTRAVADEAGSNRIGLLPLQFLLPGPPVAIGAAVGWWHLVRKPRLQPYRFVALGFLICVVLLFVTGGKPYYSAGAMPALIAAGAIVIHRPGHDRRLSLSGWLALNLIVSALIALPIIPASHIGDTPIGDINADAIEAIGWPVFMDQVEAVVDHIPAEQRATAVIFTGNYGEAGAIDYYGPARGLPPVFSAHNSYADFGMPSGSAGPVVIIGYDDPTQWFDGCTSHGQIHSQYDLDNEENGAPLWLCAAPVRPWADLWPDLRHIS
ncbi:MAG: hypothetical protein JWN99_1262 [Ilumatobacteraceae bacterium]|nr:hypothetical protein [Ilumatobacteraceae bacterium]